MIIDFIIIGAGLSGLNTAKKIKKLNIGKVLVLEKARGVGGRIATRRTLGTRFDHGAQFYKVKNDIQDLHQEWSSTGIGHHWFTLGEEDYWCAPNGMTGLPKTLIDGLDVLLENEVKSIQHEHNLWKIISQKGEVWLCRELIVSAPLPQTIKLLEETVCEKILNSDHFLNIKKIKYTKALIALVTLEENFTINFNGHLEFENGPFFSISDQKKKGVSDVPAIVITMSPNFSDNEFELADEIILEKILSLFISLYPHAKIKHSELKKWRYCRPTTQFNQLFIEIAPKLYLIGDAFGGSSIPGALRSSQALCSFLESNR